MILQATANTSHSARWIRYRPHSTPPVDWMYASLHKWQAHQDAVAGRLRKSERSGEERHAAARRRLTARAANSSYCPLGRSGSTGSPSWSSLGNGSSAARVLGLLLTVVGSLRATLGRLQEPSGGRRLPDRRWNRRTAVRTGPVPRCRFRERHLNLAAAERAAGFAVIFRARARDVNLFGLRERHAETGNEQHCRQDKSPRGALKHFEH